jgi:hypothetical protein
MWCQSCQGNGEIVTDWDRYNRGHVDDHGDEAVADCVDCGGTGYENPVFLDTGAVAAETLSLIAELSPLSTDLRTTGPGRWTIVPE